MTLVIKESPEVFLHFLDLRIEWIFSLYVLVHDIRIDKTNRSSYFNLSSLIMCLHIVSIVITNTYIC
jgi:hypothetical protein